MEGSICSQIDCQAIGTIAFAVTATATVAGVLLKAFGQEGLRKGFAGIVVVLLVVMAALTFASEWSGLIHIRDRPDGTWVILAVLVIPSFAAIIYLMTRPTDPAHTVRRRGGHR